jgi:peptidoglycan hydrolase-like protein with peptidoglycan-binding domain
MFPKYLGVGSTGPAVRLLQILLLAGGYCRSVKISGSYDAATKSGVERLQNKLGMLADDQDGEFGPLTRQTLKEKTGLDIDTVSPDLFDGETIGIGPGGKEYRVGA